MGAKHFQIGVDLGTQNTLVYVKGNGIIFNEPTVVAFDHESKKVIAVGKEAYDMIGKQHAKIDIVKPLDGGVIADFDATKVILSQAFQKLSDNKVDLKNSTLLICCPSVMTTTEKEALKNLTFTFDIKDVFVEPEVKAGAIGSGIDIFTPRGSMIIDIGGGSTDIGVLSLGDLVVSDSIRVAGNYINKEIIKYIKYKHGMEIGERTAEKIKIAIGTLSSELIEDKVYTFAGRSLKNNLPARATVKQSEIRNLVVKSFNLISNVVLKVLEKMPPELAVDVLEDGISINGGGALTEGIEEFFTNSTGLKVNISKHPLTSIAEGTKYLLQNRGNYLVKPTD